MGAVTYDVPTSLSPSRVDAFTTCPMLFRFTSIERLPEPPSIHTTKGSMVHRVLELLFCRPAAERTRANAAADTDRMLAEYAHDPELTGLELGGDEYDALVVEVGDLLDRYFQMEDPARVHEIGVELRLEAHVGDLALRGIIDRLDLDERGDLVVVDYKTGRAPMVDREQRRLGGVNFYAFLCQEVLGRRPVAVRLMYLRSGEVIEAVPTERSVEFLTRRTTAVWHAVEKACLSGDFRPRPGALCGSCAFQRWCPAFGGEPDLAAVEAATAFGMIAA